MNQVSNFIVFGLPRSRTYWASYFLSYDRVVPHCKLITFPSAEEIIDYFQDPNACVSDEVGVGIWHQFIPFLPHTKVAIIERPVEEVIAAQIKSGVPDVPQTRFVTEYLDYKMKELKRCYSDIQVFDFHTLSEEKESARLFEYCLDIPFDRTWWTPLVSRNLQNHYSPPAQELLKWADYPVMSTLIEVARSCPNIS